MLLIWEINRYARCYSDSSKQCLDFERKDSIFQYFAHLDTQRSHNIGNFWSAINKSDLWKLNLTLNLNDNRRIEFSINLIETHKITVLVHSFENLDNHFIPFKFRKSSFSHKIFPLNSKYLLEKSLSDSDTTSTE